ncbi:MAG: glycosyltransferase family 4 protein [Deltaproteobacteria bacterium]|nr:glycosyltransferase family 4 protein [Deltaproteobacteria bacterium]
MSKGYDIVVISSEPNAWKITDIPVMECLAASVPSPARHLFNQLTRTIRIGKILKTLKPHVVHIHSLDYIHPLMVGLVHGVTNRFDNLIVSTWGTDVIGNADNPGTSKGTWAKKILLRQAREITATSRFLADATAQLAPAGKTVHVIPFGIDCTMFSRKGKRAADSVVRIGFIKHLEPKYGPDDLLKAMAIIAKQIPDVHLTLVGHGQMEPFLKDLAVRLGIETHLRFTGYVPYERVPELLAGMDIFVMPSVEHSETFGVAAIEAQAMEVPVVASNVGGVSEAVMDGKTGILVEPRNIQQLAAAIIKLIREPELRQRMGEEGRRFVLQNYNIEENVRLFERLYQNLSATCTAPQ